jgi:hypothetical protein
MYIIGFYSHCDISEAGLYFMMENIAKIDNLEIKNKWIELCFLIS